MEKLINLSEIIEDNRRSRERSGSESREKEAEAKTKPQSETKIKGDLPEERHKVPRTEFLPPPRVQRIGKLKFKAA